MNFHILSSWNKSVSGQKLGLAVSITSVGEKAKDKSEEEVKQEEEVDQAEQESVNIKTEPDEVKDSYKVLLSHLPWAMIKILKKAET